MNASSSSSPFSYDIVTMRDRLTAIFRPYPLLFQEDEFVRGKPIYVESADCDEPYPFLRRSDLLGRTWWDLRYVLIGKNPQIAPTILARDFAAHLLGLGVDRSVLGRHLITFQSKARIASLNPFDALKRLQERPDFRSRLNECSSALRLQDLRLGITGSLLIDNKLNATERDMDLVIEGDHSRVEEIAKRVKREFLNHTYEHVWPLKAVLDKDLEVDLFFLPPSELINIVHSFEPTGSKSESFSGVVIDDHFSVYAPTVLACEKFVLVVLGTVIRGEFSSGQPISGRGIPGRMIMAEKRFKAFLVEDALTHLADAPRVRKEAN